MTGSPTHSKPPNALEIQPAVEPLGCADDGGYDERTAFLRSPVSPVEHRVSEESIEDDGQPSRKRANPQSLLIPFLIYCTAMGAVAVPKLNIIVALMCVQYDDKTVGASKLSNDDICSTAAIHKRLAQFMMCAHIISGVGCAVTSPRIGALSDRYGRKPLICFTALGLLCGDIVSIIAAWFPRSISVYWILLEFAIGGLSGTFGSTMAIIQAFVVDTTDSQSARVSIFSRYHAVMFIGTAVGPLAGEFFVRSVGGGDMLSIFYAALLCHGSFIAFVMFGIRESRPALSSSSSTAIDEDRKPWWSSLKPNNIYGPLQILRPSATTSIGPFRGNLPLLAIIDSLTFGIQLGFASVLILYAEYRFSWKSGEANLFTSLSNGVRALVLTVVLPIAIHLRNKTISQNEASTDDTPSESDAEPAKKDRFSINIIRLALLSDVVSHIAFAVASSTPMVLFAGLPAAAGAVVSPMAQALMSSIIDTEHVGQLFGAVSMIHAFSRIFIPASMQFVYGKTVENAPGAVFLALAGVYLGALILASRLRT